MLKLLPFMLSKVLERLSINPCRSLLALHLVGRAEEIQSIKHLIDQRVPFASSHLVSQECRQHASRPNHVMSPLGNARYLSGRGSRERHCDRDVIPFVRRSVFLCFGHFTSTFLFPFAPPRLAARLPRYYENSASCRVASTDFPDIAMFVLFRVRYSAESLGHWSRSVPHCEFNGVVVHAFTRQVSLLISFELLTIPSSTTASPFRHDRFGTLRHRHDLPVSLFGTTRKSVKTTSHRQGFAVC